MSAPLTDRIAIVTGATGGIGFETALALAAQGATTVLAARNPGKAEAAIGRIRDRHPAAIVRFAHLDLASLDSVARFAGSQPAVDILVNNGAVMGLPTRQTTDDGFERQIGVNYLSHFALTARLLPVLRPDARIVNVASLAHRRQVLDLDDFNAERSYDPMRAYGRSKLAMLMFSFALHRRLHAGPRRIRAVAAHPGWARTDIIPNGFGSNARAWLARLVFNSVAQSAAAGALPVVHAATAPGAESGGYYGPRLFGETRGRPAPAIVSTYARDRQAGSRLWAMSESLTGIIPDSCG